MKIADLSGYLIYPNPENPSLTSNITGLDHTGTAVEVDVVTERGLTVHLNKQEIVTFMTQMYMEDVGVHNAIDKVMVR